ncbi:electron-transferring-flavoprotein dehydrogenase KNAG_0E00300 [Huiozyma naganishii CBS 8797]|uniref:Electron transfer flavoprotein-ubiquinone oxidoreductase n=1 Tax=Huiozyma naganishii (strain ATCC MYA-139 / BCRC 22969 / CBS 8797 / KCTC 17520 / NBRC 10181 / NCYC 3082 / Yp74L-3) TaxID=1071383 RepID=J7RLA7_HUIN7|nr:hypothetical protein KNAG_0E00300 [Kazachstania naganishii CBS 8797]CCK70298.1 hypothetical protein KNAG_0E00300 [Kazachstania naganishii CBS 8797]
MLLRRLYGARRTVASVVPRLVELCDVCVVGGGPAGLATAIRLKQLDKDNKYRVVVLEKATDFGGHIVSGAVVNPVALKELFPERDTSQKYPDGLFTEVTEDQFKLLMGKKLAIPVPMPSSMRNKGKNWVCSLNQLTKWLSERADELGVELYPGVSVSDMIYKGNEVAGVATKDLGIDKAGKPKPDNFERGLQFQARTTLLAEGCRGSLTKEILKKYNLYGPSKQTYGLGIKEVWQVTPDKFKKGFTSHTMGYPLSKNVYGGGFQYHFGENLVAVGLVVGLDYANPYVSPYQEFQKMKHHPYYANVLEGGKCISYAARTLNEGGLQAIPQLNFPGGALVGASAGFMNVPKIKGSHTAMKSGMLAAEEIYRQLSGLESLESAIPADIEELTSENVDKLELGATLNLKAYPEAVSKSWIHDELYEVRNIRPAFNNKLFGLYGGMSYSGLDAMILKGRVPWTFQFRGTDAQHTQPAANFKAIEYPKPDGKLSFDIMTSISRTGTYHDDTEQNHLRIGPTQDLQAHSRKSWDKYQGVESRYCPAGVYEFLKDDATGEMKFVINSQNCIHCKTCDIKDPTGDTNWVVPEGGDGPKYFCT